MKMRFIINVKHQSKSIVSTESGFQEELSDGGHEVTDVEWDAYQTRAMIAEEKRKQDK